MEQRWPIGYVEQFVRESRAIESIFGPPTRDEVGTVQAFLASDEIDIPKLRKLVAAIQPGERLREISGDDVRIGQWAPPRGGPRVVHQLADLLIHVNEGRLSAYQTHVEYEMLHPFTDGNGRSGRVLWLWVVGHPHPRSFLHQFYYDTLADIGGEHRPRG
jgi:hypothetical protein